MTDETKIYSLEDGTLVGVLVEREEYLEMSADQLRDVIASFIHIIIPLSETFDFAIIRRDDGTREAIDGDHYLIDYDHEGIRFVDGCFEIIEKEEQTT